jgi:two-component system, sensor histidine kinase
VELHGGRVRASSAGLGKGSEFEVRLPVGALSESTSERIESPGTALTAASHVALVVDDNVDAATLLGEALKRRGHQVHLAHDGASAIQLAARITPEIVLLDLALPDRDGYEVAARLRTDLGLTESLLVAVTGYGQEHHRARSAASGFTHHLVKPIDLRQLDQVITAWERSAAAKPVGTAEAST